MCKSSLVSVRQTLIVGCVVIQFNGNRYEHGTKNKKLIWCSRYRVTIRSVIAVDRLTLTVTLNMTYINFISLIELSMRGINTVCQLAG